MNNRLINIIFLFVILIPGMDGLIWAKPVKWKVKDVRFENNMRFSEKRLHKILLMRPSRFLSRTLFNETLFEDDLLHLVGFYRDNGYLNTKIISHSIIRDSTNHHLSILIRIDEGARTFIDQIGIVGGDHFTHQQIMEKTGLQSGMAFMRGPFEKSVVNLLRFYAENAYLDAKINPSVLIDTTRHLVTIRFDIDEDRSSIAHNTIINGLEKTKPRIVTRESLFESGDPIRYSELLKMQRQLYLTGLFNSVFIKPVDAGLPDSTLKTLQISVRENPSREFGISGGYGSVDKLRGRLELSDQNLFGTAQKAAIIMSLSAIHRGLEIAFTEPWTLGTRWRSDLNLKSDYQEEPGYFYQRLGGRVTFGRKLLERTDVKIRFRRDYTELSEVRIASIPADLSNNIRSLSISLAYDSRDNLFDTRRGLYTIWTHEIGKAFSEASNTFYRMLFELKFFRQYRGWTVGSALDLGWMVMHEGLESVPLQERFYAGGPNSIRGVKYQKAGRLDSRGLATGGRLKTIWHVLELRHSLYKGLGFAVFLDAGSVWPDPEQIDWRDSHVSPGLGLRFGTPIGVARLDFCILANPRTNEPGSLWVFNMGQAF